MWINREQIATQNQSSLQRTDSECQAEVKNILNRMPPMMLVHPSMAIKSKTATAVAEETQQPCAKPAAMPAAAASVLLSSSTELRADA